ncbi:MAG: ATP-binding protein, partial [Natronospirillum sp.]
YRLRRQVDQLSFQQRFVSAQLDLTKHLQDAPETPEAEHMATFSTQVFGDPRVLTLNDHYTDPLTGARGLSSDPELTRGLPDGWKSLVRALGEQWLAYQERHQAKQERKAAERRADEESLRNALLSSVSHDLKTPLVTMMGAATSLRDLHADLDDNDRQELLNSIILESERLEHYIQNLLDMTRLGQGELTLNRQWISVEELYHVVYRRLASARPSPNIRFQPSGDIPSVWVHAALIEQALFNALDNALKAVGSTGVVELHAGSDATTVWMDVLDQGPGLPRDQWEAVFGQFYSFSRGDRYSTGSGLGLTICRGMMRVHGGEAAFVEPPDGFTLCLRLTLPLTSAAADSANMRQE